MPSFRKGEIVYRDSPYATVVLDERLKDTCNWCFAHPCSNKIQCGDCLQATYCSTGCRDKDLGYHDFECGLLQWLPASDSAVHRFTLRTLARVLDEQEEDSVLVGSFFEHRRTFEDLVSHADVMDEQRVKSYKKVSEELFGLLADYDIKVTVDNIVEVMQRLSINGTCVHHHGFIDDIHLGNAVYLGASKIEHTCEFISNYIVLYDGNRFTLKALRDFSVSDSLEITINYIPVELSLAARRKRLQEHCCFTCECVRCVEESEEPQLQILTALDEFLGKAVSDGSMQLMLEWEKRFADFPNTEPFKNKLLIKIFLEGKRTTAERSLSLATSALEGCRSTRDRMRVLILLCQHLHHFGAGNPSHKLHREFKDHHREAMTLLTDVYGEYHRLTLAFAGLNSSDEPSQSSRVETAGQAGKTVLEA